MEIRQIQHFLRVVEHGSFSGAATAFGITQQTISKSIAALEANLGVRLFDRDTRNCELTGHGELLLNYAANIDAEHRQFHRHLDDILGLRSGRLRVGAGLTAAVHIVPLALQRLKSKRPDLHLSVIDGTARSLMPMLMRGDLDIIVCVIAKPIKDQTVSTETLFEERMKLLARAQHPLATRRRFDLKATTSFPWMAGWTPDGLDQAVRDTFEHEGIKPPVAKIETDSFTFARSVLCNTDHLAVLPEHLFAAEIDTGLIATLNVATKFKEQNRPMSICYRRNSTRSPAAMACVTELKAVMADAKAAKGLR